MEEKQLVKALRVLAKTQGTAWIAVQLGYKTDDAICCWIKRKKIPSYRHQDVRRILEEKKSA